MCRQSLHAFEMYKQAVAMVIIAMMMMMITAMMMMMMISIAMMMMMMSIAMMMMMVITITPECDADDDGGADVGDVAGLTASFLKYSKTKRCFQLLKSIFDIDLSIHFCSSYCHSVVRAGCCDI